MDMEASTGLLPLPTSTMEGTYFSIASSESAAMVVSLQNVYKDLGESNKKGKAAQSLPGLLGKPVQAFQILAAQLTYVAAAAVVEVVQGIFAGDLLVLMCAIWAALIMLLVLPAIGRLLMYHPSQRWATGWIQFLDFVAYVTCIFIIAYAMGMLKQLWVGTLASPWQLVVLTVVLIEVVMLIFGEVADRMTNHHEATHTLVNVTIAWLVRRNRQKHIP